MIRSSFAILFAVLIVGCADMQRPAKRNIQASTPEGRVVERAILWEGKLDENWNPIALERLLKDEERFEDQGGHYLALKPIVIFGYRAAYVGMLGVGQLVGPNAVLAGSPKSIANTISKTHGVTFHSKDGVYVCDYKPTIRLLIQEHPEIKGGSIIIGAYVGPR